MCMLAGTTEKPQALLVPTQLSIPFNSASDDFAYVVDEQTDLVG